MNMTGMTIANVMELAPRKSARQPVIQKLQSHNCQAAGHLQEALLGSNVFKIATACAALMKDLEFDAILCSDGISGMAISPVVAAMMGKPLVVVRKNKNKAHSNLMVEGDSRAYEKLIIIDDFTHSGETIRYILDEVYDNLGRFFNPCVAIVLYLVDSVNGDKSFAYTCDTADHTIPIIYPEILYP